MVILLVLLLVLLFAGIGFTAHLFWIVAAILLVLWLAGMALGRGEGAGRHRFYRWQSRPRDSEAARIERSEAVDHHSRHGWRGAMVACILANCITGAVSMWVSYGAETQVSMAARSLARRPRSRE